MTRSGLNRVRLLISTFLIVLVVVFGVVSNRPRILVERIPDFAAMSDVKQKKAAFFEYMYSHVEQANISILLNREFLQGLLEQPEDTLTGDQLDRLARLANSYTLNADRYKPHSLVRKLLLRVDLIPPSLVLAQSANESAWGTSRFAREGNNYFGQWCYTQGCGLVPAARTAGASHEVRRFDSPADSVQGYMNNLNTGSAYRDLRSIRAESRARQGRPGGERLADGLQRYSERGQSYIDEIRSMIRVNRLERYDQRFWSAMENRI